MLVFQWVDVVCQVLNNITTISNGHPIYNDNTIVLVVENNGNTYKNMIGLVKTVKQFFNTLKAIITKLKKSNEMKCELCINSVIRK